MRDIRSRSPRAVAERVHVRPNGVDTRRFRPRAEGDPVRAKLVPAEAATKNSANQKTVVRFILFPNRNKNNGQAELTKE